MVGVDHAAAVRFLTTVFEPEDWVAIFLKSHDSKIWTIQYQDASLNQTESSKTSDKKKAQHLLRLREGAVARRERIVVEDLTAVDDGQ